VFGYYTDAVCEEYDYYEDEYGECIEWTCDALAERIDELLGELDDLAPQWNDSIGPITTAEDNMYNWQFDEDERQRIQREEQAAEVDQRKETYDELKDEMRYAQEVLNAANRDLTQNRDPDLIAELQMNQMAAQDEFDLAEAAALNAEYFW